jgi:hypothetical protein
MYSNFKAQNGVVLWRRETKRNFSCKADSIIYDILLYECALRNILQLLRKQVSF